MWVRPSRARTGPTHGPHRQIPQSLQIPASLYPSAGRASRGGQWALENKGARASPKHQEDTTIRASLHLLSFQRLGSSLPRTTGLHPGRALTERQATSPSSPSYSCASQRSPPTEAAGDLFAPALCAAPGMERSRICSMAPSGPPGIRQGVGRAEQLGEQQDSGRGPRGLPGPELPTRPLPPTLTVSGVRAALEGREPRGCCGSSCLNGILLWAVSNQKPKHPTSQRTYVSNFHVTSP